MIWIYLLSALWSIGLTVLFVRAICSIVENRDWWTLVGALTLGASMTIALGGMPWLFILEERSPDLATLKKNEWTCSASHQLTTMTPVLIGKIFIYMPQTQTVCDQYSRT